MNEVQIEQLTLRRVSRVLEVRFAGGAAYALPFQYLRVNSPSAEVQGHGPGEGVLVVGKENVQIRRVEPVGQYAVRLVFDDGHDSGLYTWKYLQQLAVERESRWRDYQQRVVQAQHGSVAGPGPEPGPGPGPEKERPG